MEASNAISGQFKWDSIQTQNQCLLRPPEVTRNLPLLICLEAAVAHSSRAKQPSAAEQVAQHGGFYDPCSLKEQRPKERGRKESRAIDI